MKKNMMKSINGETGMVRKMLGEALIFLLVMLAAMQLFVRSGDCLCPLTAATIVGAVSFGFAEIVTALKEAVDI